MATAILFIALFIALFTVIPVLVIQSHQLEQRIKDLEKNSNCTCATLEVNIQELEAIDLQRNISDLSNKVSALQANDMKQEAHLQSLGTTQTDQGYLIEQNREQTETIAEDFTALDEKVNSSISDTAQKLETAQKAIAANTYQIGILNATVRDAYSLRYLGVNITRVLMKNELLEAQLHSVNTSVQLQGESIEKLRVDTLSNISDVRERTQDSLNVIRDEVSGNTNELNDTRTSLSGRIDEVESEQMSHKALLSQHIANITNLENEVGVLKSSGKISVGLLTSFIAVLVIAVALMLRRLYRSRYIEKQSSISK